jgi:hypothetical protein
MGGAKRGTGSVIRRMMRQLVGNCKNRGDSPGNWIEKQLNHRPVFEDQAKEDGKSSASMA